MLMGDRESGNTVLCDIEQCREEVNFSRVHG